MLAAARLPGRVDGMAPNDRPANENGAPAREPGLFSTRNRAIESTLSTIQGVADPPGSDRYAKAGSRRAGEGCDLGRGGAGQTVHEPRSGGTGGRNGCIESPSYHCARQRIPRHVACPTLRSPDFKSHRDASGPAVT